MKFITLMLFGVFNSLVRKNYSRMSTHDTHFNYMKFNNTKIKLTTSNVAVCHKIYHQHGVSRNGHITSLTEIFHSTDFSINIANTYI